MPDGPLDNGRAGRRARPAEVLPISCEGIVVNREGRQLLDGTTLDIDGTALSVMMGANGAGKSLLLRVMANLIPPDRGRVTWAGRQPDRARAPRLGFVFQKPVLLRRSVVANIRYALSAAGVRGRAADDRVSEALARAHLETFADTQARVLSGGEQQRLALARALALEPEVLLLDEPTSNLDPTSTAAIERLVRDAAQAGAKVLLVTHEIAQARRLAEEVIFVHRGRIAERSPAEQFFESPDSVAARNYLEGRLDP